ncbi:MAG: site-2 protease family protein, partial [Hyphomonadaceae bacterium]
LGSAALAGGLDALRAALVFLAAILLAVRLNEFGHAGMAAALQLRSKHIVLTFFGGYVEFEQAPRARWQEIAVSFAGPAVNLLCAALLPFVIRALSETGWPSRETPLALAFFDSFFYVSLILGAFNLLPGYPLDGGRILREALAYIMPPPRAYLIAAWVGLLIAVGIGAWAIAQQYWWTVFIGALLALAAWGEIRRLRAQSAAGAGGDMSNA